MSCRVCSQAFDIAARRPLVLCCGHTSCKACLEKEPNNGKQGGRKRWQWQCPRCSQVSDRPPIPNIDELEAAERQRSLLVDQLAADNEALLRQQEEALQKRREELQRATRSKDPAQLEALRVKLRCNGESPALFLQQADGSVDPGTDERENVDVGGPEVPQQPVQDAERSGVAARGPVILEVVGRYKPEIEDFFDQDTEPIQEDTDPPEDYDAVEDAIESLSQTGLSEKKDDKLDLLPRVAGIRKIGCMHCEEDPAWTLLVLQRAAPTLQALAVQCPQPEHLRAFHTMPRLRRLCIHAEENHSPCQVPKLPVLPDGGGLTWLRVTMVPKPDLVRLLRAHAHSLETLILSVGTRGRRPFPQSCGDLHTILRQSRLGSLQRLDLWRYAEWSYSNGACEKQIEEVRRVLPGAVVRCRVCDDLEFEAL